MTNKQRYQRTFMTLQASQPFVMEVKTMKMKTKLSPRRLAMVGAAVILVVALACSAYAADVGGIRRTVQIWLNGDQTTAVLDVQDGKYTLTFPDGREQMGGGVAIEPDGQERPLTDEEILEELNSPQVVCRDDGTIWVYYRDQAMDITQRFVDGVAYVQVKDGDQVLYLTVSEQGSYTSSPHGYVSPDSVTD